MPLVRHIPTLGLATLLALWAAPAVAQMEPTPAQREYNDRGVKLMFDGDFDAAAANFQSSLALGESNIAWLNYGRALFKLQRCREARHAFDQVEGAPAVASPSVDEISGVLERFRGEWAESCSASLVLQCAEPATVRVDSGQPFACSAEPVPVVPGGHEVALLDPRTNEVVATWDIEAGIDEPAEVIIEPPDEPEQTDTEPDADASSTVSELEPSVEESSGPGTGRIIGLTMLGVGGGALAAALVLDRVWVAPAFQSYEDAATAQEWETRREAVRGRQQVNRGLLIGAAILSVSGLAITLVSRPEQPTVALGLTGRGIAAEVTW